MNARIRKAQRGQAVVETVLGMLVFVTLFVFAIFFSETLYASLKVQEASTSAMWDSTAGKMHDWPNLGGLTGGTDPAIDTVRTATQSANTRYADFDGRTNVNRSSVFTQTFARATNLNVQCNVGSGPDYPGGFSLAYAAVRAIYADNGGLSCRSSASLSAVNFPSSFLDTSPRSTFKVKNYQNTPIQLCGVGRAINGQCGRYEMMLDDWGLAGGDESGICVMVPDYFGLPVATPCAPNVRYWGMNTLLYMETSLLVPARVATDLAVATVGYSPINEDRVWMAFEGESPTFFTQPIFPNDGFLPLFPWPTNPGGATLLPWQYMQSYSGRTGCFLGNQCN